MPIDRSGQITGNTDDREMFLKVFGGEVLAKYHEVFKLRPHLMRKPASKGMKEAQFPIFADTTASFHVPGTTLPEQGLNKGEKTIALDESTVASIKVPDIDAMLEHFDSRSIYSSELAQALARQNESQALKMLVKASKSPALVTGTPAGQEIDDIAADAASVNAADLIAALAEAAARLDEANVPEEGRYALVTPDDHRKLVGDTTALNRDWGGSGSLAAGTLPEIQGIKLIKSNRLRIMRGNDFAAVTGEKNDYAVDMAGLVANVFHTSAVGYLERMAPTMLTWWNGDDLTWRLTARDLTGYGFLRPEASININATA